MKLRESLFPVDIRRPSSGVKLLGGAVSRDAYFISGLAMRRAANAVDLMSLLLQLHDPQSEHVWIPLGNMRFIVKSSRDSNIDMIWPADVLVFGWVERKHACVDLIGVSPLVGLSSNGVTRAVKLLSRGQRVMHSNVMTPRSKDVVFKRIGFAIQKGLAAQLVVRLPSTTMCLAMDVFACLLVLPCIGPISKAIIIYVNIVVMVALIISISSDSSEESVGSHASRVILFGVIPAIIPVILEVPIVPADPIVISEVGTVSVVSPVGVLDLVDYSYSSDSDPSEDSLPPAPDLPLVLPFLCSGVLEADGESEPVEQRPVSSSLDTLAPLSDFPLAPVVSPPGIRRRPAILVWPGEAIPSVDFIVPTSMGCVSC
ncbi:hypothetical protein Tco_0146138 [Tanacetum coccineum]